MTFRVGQKVAQRRPWSSIDTAYPDVVFTCCGPVYTIREILEVDGTSALRFFEIRNPIRKYRGRGALEQPFPAWNFRPIVERKTDISIFTSMLKSSKVDA